MRRLERWQSTTSNNDIKQRHPEDTILAKLERYRMDGEVSDRQWRDILGVLKPASVNSTWTICENGQTNCMLPIC